MTNHEFEVTALKARDIVRAAVTAQQAGSPNAALELLTAANAQIAELMADLGAAR